MQWPNCHAEVTAGAAYCSNCGTALGQPGASQPNSQPALPMQGGVAPTWGYPTSPSQPFAPYGQPLPPGYMAPPSQPIPPGYAAPLSQPFAPYSQPLASPQPASPSQPFMPGVFGAPAGPTVPRTQLQASLQRNFAGGLGTSLWFVALLGAAAAAIVGIILSIVAQILWAGLVNTIVATSLSSSASEVLGGPISSFLSGDLPKMFAIANHVPLAYHVSAGAAGVTGNIDGLIDLPLTGLLIIPAAACTLGGYISASSDYTGQPRFSIARGALIAPFYAVVTLVLALAGSSSLSGGALEVSGSATIGPDPVRAFLYGLLWGAVFGGLGGWIQVSGRHWLTAILPTIQSSTQARVYGAIAGAVVAIVTGVLMFLAVLFGVLAFASVQAAGQASTQTTETFHLDMLSGLGAIVEAVLIVGPPLAFWALSLASGAPLMTNVNTTGPDAINQTQSLSLIGAQHPPLPEWLLLMVVVPAIAYLAGGRVSARAARATETGSAFVAGALMAVPLSILMAALAAATSAGFSASTFGQNASESAGPSIGGTFLAALVAGAVVGGLGGVTAVGMARLGDLLRAPLAPFRLLARGLLRALDRATGHGPGEPRTAARAWLYDGVLAVIVMGVIVIAADIATVATANDLRVYQIATQADPWIAAVLIALPLLYFIGALVSAVAAPPVIAGIGVAPSAGAPASVPVGVPAWTPYSTPGMSPPVMMPPLSGPASMPVPPPGDATTLPPTPPIQ